MHNKKSNQATNKKHRINFIDLIVLLIILSIVGALVIWIDPLNLISKETVYEEKTVICVFELDEISADDNYNIEIDDEVVFINDGPDIGKVISVEKVIFDTPDNPEPDDQTASDGDEEEVVEFTYYVTVEFNCTYKEGIGYFLNSQQLLVGKTLELQFPMLKTNCECISIQVK